MSKIANLDFDDENIRKAIMKKYFTKLICFGTMEKETLDKKITLSPIVRELYLRETYREIDFDDIVRDLEKMRAKNNIEILFSESQIGKATINVPTQKKDEAKQHLQQELKRNVGEMEQTQ